MNILYCGDDGIKDGVLVSVLSLLKNNTEPLKIYIATINYENVKPFKVETAEFLNKLVKGKVELAEDFLKNTNEKSFVKLIDATEVFVKNLPSKNMGSYFTPCSMLRLYMDKMSEIKDLDRILYLDYDVLCKRSLLNFYYTDMTGIEAVGVLDKYGRRFYRYHGIFNQDYMNSGVMLFNIKECLKSDMFGRAVELCGKRWMMLADQAALNKTITKRKLMPAKYNDQNERPSRDTVLHHFSNNFKFLPFFHVQKVKPFEIEKVHNILKIHVYDDILEEYMRLKKELN